MEFLRATLDNGLTLIGERNPEAKSVAAAYLVRTGARDETAAEAGLSHFLEHMLFKGTPRRTAEDVNREFDELGAQYNAFTTEEATLYYGAVLPEFQGRVLDLLTDMMRPSLRPADFDMEKQVILEEIALYQDRPEAILNDAVRAAYFGGHPLGNSVLGTTASVTALTPEQMRDYFDRRYAPGNLTLALTGCFDWEAARSLIEDLSGDWQPNEAPRDLAEATPHALVKAIPADRFQRQNIALLAPGCSAQDPRRYAADILGHMLGGGEGSRLHRALVEPGLAEMAHCSHAEEDGAGVFGVHLACDPGRAQEVLDVARGVLAEVTESGFDELELRRSQRQAAAALVLQEETPLGRLIPFGFDWLYRHEIVALDEVIDRYLAVTLDDVTAILAGRPFDTMAVLGLGPATELH